MKFILKKALWLHNASYRLVNILVVFSEKGLHPKHRLTGYHQFFLDNVNPTDRVLDVGCSQGFLSFDLAKKVKKVVGIDISEKNITQAKKRFSAPNLEFILGNAFSYNFSGNFDVVVLSNVLEHIENRIDFLKKIIIAPKALIRVPFLERDWLVLYKKELGVEYRLDQGHFVEYTLSGFQDELRQAGLKLQSYVIKFGEIWAVITKSNS